jgi:hypothetical protein
MADIAATNWNQTDASNTDAAPDGMPEGMAPSGVNNWGRAVQGAVKRWYTWTIPATTGGTSTAYTLTYSVAPGALVDGMTHLVQFNAVNGATPTLNINSLGAKPLHFYLNGAWAAMPANMLAADQVVEVTYNSAAGTYRCIGLQPVLTQTITGGSSGAAFTGIPANVNNLQCFFEFDNVSDNLQINLTTYGADGVEDTASVDYSYALQSVSSGGTTSISGATLNAAIVVATFIDNSDAGVGGDFTAANIQAATRTKFTYRTYCLEQAGAVFVSANGGGCRNEADRITGFRIAPTGQTTGKVTVVLS